MNRARTAFLGVALAAWLTACGRMSQAGCVGAQYASVRNLSADVFEVLLHYRERGSQPHPIGSVPAGATIDFEIPNRTYVTVRYQQPTEPGGTNVLPELQRISYSCR